MATFRTQVFYILGTTGKWTNVYHTSAADILTAANAWATVAEPYLVTMLDENAVIAKYLTSDPGSDDFIIDPRNTPGESTGGSNLLPLFNSVKVYLDPAGFGRPDYKFVKGFLSTDLISAGVILSGAVGVVQDAFDGMIADMATAGAPLCADDGALYSVASVQTRVQMRQEHRKRKKTIPAP